MIELTKLTRKAYLELVPQAEAVGYNLLLDTKLSLVRYNEKRGTVSHISFYEYNDTQDYQEIREILSEKASKLRERWAPEFMTFAPMLTSLGMKMDPLEFWVKITNQNGIQTARFYYGPGNLRLMVDYIGSLFAEQDLPSPKETEENAQDKKGEQNDDQVQGDTSKKAKQEEHFADLAEHFNMGPKELGTVMRKYGLSLTALEELAEKQKKAEEKEEAENALS